MNIDNLTEEAVRKMLARLQRLEEENNLLRNEVARPNTPVKNQTPNVVVQPNLGSIASKPPKYDGSRKMVALNIFVSKMRNFIAAQANLDVQRQLAVASSYLEGSAYVWFLKWSNDNPYGSFDQFLNDLHAQFVPMNSEQDVRDRLRRLKQLSSVEKYVDLFRKTLEEAPDMDELEKKSFFIYGLKEKIQLEVRVKNLGNVLTFNELELLALELDHIIFSPPRRVTNYPSSNRVPMEGVQFGYLKPPATPHTPGSFQGRTNGRGAVRHRGLCKFCVSETGRKTPAGGEEPCKTDGPQTWGFISQLKKTIQICCLRLI